MTEKIIDLQKVKEDNQPHISGPALCLDCKHEWVAVAPAQTTWLECTECGLMRGRFKYHHERPGLHWTYSCGNKLFYVTPDGYYCPNCGEWQYGF